MAAKPALSIGSRTLRGMAWAYSSYVGGRVLVLVSTAVLAHLLEPRDFGLVALAVTFFTLLDTVSDLGVSQALVVAPDEEAHDRADTVFVFGVSLGVVATLVTAALAPLAALFFDQPQLTLLLPVLGLNFILRALGVTHYALAQKQIDFRTRTAAEFADVLVRGATGVALALAGLGAWSLVIGYLVGTVALDVTLWRLIAWRPSLRLSRAHLRAMLRFGGTLSAVDVISAVISEMDYIFVGRVLGATSLGLYVLGFRLPELIVINLSIVAGKVLFPAFASIDRDSLSRAFLVSLRYTLTVGLPLSALLSVLARPFTFAVFGDKWAESVPVMQVLTIFALAVTVGIPAGTAYKATGRADVLLKLAIPRAVLVITALALFVDRGIVAAAASQAAVAGLFSIIGIALASRLLSVRAREIGEAVWPPLAATVVMAPAVVAIERAITSPWPALIAGGAAGLALYLAGLWIVAPDMLRRLWALAVGEPSAPPPVEQPDAPV